MNLGNVVIVGNGGCLLNQNLGKRIDSCDYIVRMGECRIKGYEKYVGAKTNMYRMKWFNAFNCEKNISRELFGSKRDFDFKFDDILYTFQDFDDYQELPFNRKNHSLGYRTGDILQKLRRFRIHHDKLCNILKFAECKSIHFFSSFLYEKLKMELGITNCDHDPTAGLCTIFYFLNKMKYNKLYIAGFDGFVSGHYWRPNEKFHCYTHEIIKEKIYLTKLIKSKQIAVLS
jgi:hypothetical protein